MGQNLFVKTLTGKTITLLRNISSVSETTELCGTLHIHSVQEVARGPHMCEVNSDPMIAQVKL